MVESITSTMLCVSRLKRVKVIWPRSDIPLAERKIELASHAWDRRLAPLFTWAAAAAAGDLQLMRSWLYKLLISGLMSLLFPLHIIGMALQVPQMSNLSAHDAFNARMDVHVADTKQDWKVQTKPH